MEAGEHGEGRVSEAAFGAFAAEAAVEPPDGGPYLPTELGSLHLGFPRLGSPRLGGPLFSCVLLHRSLVYLTKPFVYLNV
jgi:hypothetical protein